MKRLLLTALLLATPAHAGDESPTRMLTIRNNTSAAVNQLFVSGGHSNGLRARVNGVFGAPDGERDRLDAKMLPRGGSIVVALKGERCRYDLRAVLEDGRSFVADDYDVCASGSWAIGSGTRQ